MSGNDGVPVSAEFDEKAVYVIDGPDGISQVVASAEEFQVRNHLTKNRKNCLKNIPNQFFVYPL